MVHEAASATQNVWTTWIGHVTLPAADLWVDFTYQGGELGTYDAPYSSISAALPHLPPGGNLVMKGGVTREAPTITTPCKLKGFSGTVLIGAP